MAGAGGVEGRGRGRRLSASATAVAAGVAEQLVHSGGWQERTGLCAAAERAQRVLPPLWPVLWTVGQCSGGGAAAVVRGAQCAGVMHREAVTSARLRQGSGLCRPDLSPRCDARRGCSGSGHCCLHVLAWWQWPCQPVYGGQVGSGSGGAAYMNSCRTSCHWPPVPST